MAGLIKRAAIAAVAAASMATAGALALGQPFTRTLAADAPAKLRQTAATPAAGTPAPAQGTPNPAAASPSAPPAAGTPVRALPDFTAIVKQYGQAVVNVSVVGKGGMDDDDSGEDMPRRFGFPPFMIPHGAPQPSHGIGSGFIVKSDGVILTNAHVVRGASEVTVKLTDKREFKAKVVGQDKETDVAVLRIQAKDLPTVRIGDANRAQVGEWVLAIGSPFGFENTATSGIISARARSLTGQGYVPFLQTDVPVNPGNSGGPLFNLQGEVIGINSQIYSGSGGYMGISFAIPINVAMKVEQQLLATGKVTRGRLGVMIQDVNAQLARSFGLPRPQGALVANIEKGGPASSSDLKPGDVILAVNGQQVDSSADLPPRIADLPPGQNAKLKVWRNGKELALDVKVGATGEERTAASDKGAAAPGRLGLQVRSLTPEERSQADLPGGVLVQGVTGPAARAGIQPGDVVLAVNGNPINNVDQLKKVVKDAEGGVALLVQRGDARIFVPVDLG